MPPKIIFKNKPKLSENADNEVQVRFNERRASLISPIEEFISKHERFQGKEISVTFSQEGASSLVLILESLDEKLVLKVSLSVTNSFGEAKFLQVWEEVGVKVPKIFESGYITDHPYILMEFIDAPLLSTLYTHEERLARGVYEEMGKTLRLMHEPKARGFGRVTVDGQAEYDNFSDWLFSESIQKKIDLAREYGLLNKEHGSSELALDVLKTFVGDKKESSYCHDDFGGNIFATKPLTVFDPNPMFNDPYLDIGRTIANHVAQGVFPHGFLEGYFAGEAYNERALHAAVFLNIVMKLPYQLKNKRSELVRNAQNYLVENRKFLEV